MPLDNLVKMSVPLTGTFENVSVNCQKQFILPVELRETFAVRQGVSKFSKVWVYKALSDDGNIMARLTDMPDEKDYALFKLQHRSEGRYVLGRKPAGNKVTIMGHGNYVDVIEG